MKRGSSKVLNESQGNPWISLVIRSGIGVTCLEGEEREIYSLDLEVLQVLEILSLPDSWRKKTPIWSLPLQAGHT